jgi:chromosomal replication initiation ATPase DnaA
MRPIPCATPPPAPASDLARLAAAAEALYAEVRALRAECRALRPDPLADKREAVEDLLRLVAAEAGVTSEQILGPRRRADIALARHLTVRLWRERLGLRPGQIARLLGRHHSAVSHSLAQAADRLSTGDPAATRLAARIEARLRTFQDQQTPP